MCDCECVPKSRKKSQIRVLGMKFARIVKEFVGGTAASLTAVNGAACCCACAMKKGAWFVVG